MTPQILFAGFCLAGLMAPSIALADDIVPGARHYIMLEKPQAVIDAINQVLAQARSTDVGK